MAVQFDDREAYLTQASALILGDIIAPFIGDRTLPTVRISCGFPPSTRAVNKVIAVCYTKACSTGGVNELFVTPRIDQPMPVLEAVAHELIHACDDCRSGHSGFFAFVARRIGLEGKLTATHAGGKLRAKLQEIADLLGDYPHQRMELRALPKQGTRMLKIACTACGWSARTSEAMIKRLEAGNQDCPACHDGRLQRADSHS
jgi:hypothetical protein